MIIYRGRELLFQGEISRCPYITPFSSSTFQGFNLKDLGLILPFIQQVSKL